MRKLVILGVMMIVVSEAWADYEQTPAQPIPTQVTCDVKGNHQVVRTSEECKRLGGVLIP